MTHTAKHSELSSQNKALENLQAENDALRQQLEALAEQLAAGLNKPAFERALLAQPIAYALAGKSDSQQDYANLLNWLRREGQVFARQPEALEQDKFHLHERWLHLNAELNGLRERLAASRWPQVRRHVPAVEAIRRQVEECWQQADQALIRQQTVIGNSFVPRLVAPVSSVELPPPRPLSALHPTYMSVAGSDLKPLYMETVAELGKTPLMLDSPDAYLSFTLHCTAADFYRLDLLFGTCLRANPVHLRLIVRALNAQGQAAEVLRVVHFDGLEVLDNQFFPLSFAPLADSAGKSYWLEVDAPDATPDTALALWCHAKTPYLTPATPVAADSLQAWHTLPLAAQNLLLDVPLSPRLHAQQPQQVFLLTLDIAPNRLNLQVFLLRLSHWLEAAQSQAQLWYCGHLPPDLAHSFPALQQGGADWIDTLQAVQHQNREEIIFWNMRLSALPEADLLASVERLWAEDPQAALLLPLEYTPDERICAAYAVPVREGRLCFPAVGAAITAPEHGYRRKIQAAHSDLLMLRGQRALREIDWQQLRRYRHLAYQISELIQQLQAQGWHSLYQGSWRYAVSTAPTLDGDMNADAALFAHRWSAAAEAQLPPFATRAQLLNPQQQPSVLVINDTLPEYDQDSASLRLYTLLKLWVGLGYHLSFVADNADTEPRYRRALEDLGVEVFCGNFQVQQAMAWRQFAIALICRVEVGHRYIPFVRLLSPNTQIWYDTVDIHYLREQRQAEIEANPTLAQQALLTKRKELHNCRMADEVLTVTEADGQHLQQELPWRSFQVLSNIHTRPTLPPVPLAQRDGLVFVGNYHHAPNEDAVYFFVKHVLPLIVQRLPDVPFYIIGSHLSEKMREWAQKTPNVQAIGWVEDLEPALAQRRLFVSYLRYGAGMKGKLGQAMALGLPVVSTSIGAEGMDLEDGATALIADEPAAFADAVCRLYADADLWQKLATQGQALIEERYGETAVRRQLQSLLAMQP